VAAAAGRPRSSRGGSSKTSLAFDLGRKGEHAPAWLGDDPRYSDAYENGVSERDRSAAGAPAREPEPAPGSDNVTDIGDAPSARKRRTGGRARKAWSSTTGSQRWPGFVSTGGGLVVSSTGNIGSAILGAFGYALLVNILKGTGTAWLKAKWTNGDGKLP
jgi:hypothetical protein